MSTSHLALAAALSAGLALSPSAAQVPDGWAVTASFEFSAVGYQGLGGLFLVHPSDPSVVVPVTGLPPEVTGAAWPGAFTAGADFVVHRPDGSIATNGWGSTGTTMPVFVLRLVGPAVVNVDRYDVGTIASTAGLGLPGAQHLPDGKLAILVDPNVVGAPGEPLAGAILGIVDLNLPPGAPAVVQAVPVAPVPTGNPNGLAVDAVAGTAYIATNSTTTAASDVWRVPFPAGGTPQLVAAVPGTVTGMALDNQSRLLLATSGMGNALQRLDPATGSITAVPVPFVTAKGLVFDAVSGDTYFVADSGPFAAPQAVRVAAGGTVTPLSQGPVNGWGSASGISYNPNPEPYGAVPAGPVNYRWLLAPNPGGLPRVGNGSFSLSVASDGSAPAASLLFSATAAAAVPQVLLGLPVLLDPTASLTTSSMTVGATMQTALPVPNDPALIGAELFFQSLHIHPVHGFGVSPGLALTVLP